MAQRAEGVRLAHPLFQAGGGGETPTSALQLWVHRIEYVKARELNALWHSRLPRIGDPANVMRQTPCFAGTCDGVIYVVAIWSHPVSRSLPQKTWLELRRMAVGPGAPRNTPSRFLAVMARLLRKQEPQVERLISYQDLGVHTGAIYRAAGWVPTVVSKGSTWNKPNSRNLSGRPRVRPADQSTADKQRWEKVLHGSHQLDGVRPPGAEADVPLPGRRGTNVRGRDANRNPGLWEAPG